MSGSRAEIDQDTFRRFQEGGAEEAMVIVETHHRRLIAFLRTQVADRDLAEDLAQEVFLEAYRSRRTIRGPEQLRAWMFTVGARLASRERQKHRHRVDLSAEELDRHLQELQEGPRQAEGLLRDEARAHLEDALAALPPEDRELVLLRFFGELPIKALAESLRMPMGSVGVKLGRALARIRTSLEKAGHSLESLL